MQDQQPLTSNSEIIQEWLTLQEELKAEAKELLAMSKGIFF